MGKSVQIMIFNIDTILQVLFFQIQLLWWDHGKTESWLRCEVNSHNVPGCRPRLGREDTRRNIEDDLSDAHSLQSRSLHSPQSRLHKWWVQIIQWGKFSFIIIDDNWCFIHRQISIIKTFHTHLRSMSSCSTSCADVLVLENCTVPTQSFSSNLTK